jgi:hypothetical protein
MEGLLRCPMLEVVCRGSWLRSMSCGLMVRKASITTLPLTDWIGSITTATARWFSCSKLCHIEEGRGVRQGRGLAVLERSW